MCTIVHCVSDSFRIRPIYVHERALNTRHSESFNIFHLVSNTCIGCLSDKEMPSEQNDVTYIPFVLLGQNDMNIYEVADTTHGRTSIVN